MNSFDTLKIARCTSDQLDSFIATLNDCTLVVTSDTEELYTKINGNKVSLNHQSNIVPLKPVRGATFDLPLHKELSFYASNIDNIPIKIGEFIGLCGTDNGEFKLCDALSYNGEFL